MPPKACARLSNGARVNLPGGEETSNDPSPADPAVAACHPCELRIGARRSRLQQGLRQHAAADRTARIAAAAERLVALRRRAQRILEACRSGHVEDPRALFDRLDRGKD